MRQLPELVCKLTAQFDAWIVGSAADPNNPDPRDYDVVVPFYKWGEAAQLIPENAKPNSFGGWKCTSENKEVDVWPGDLGWIMLAHMCKFAWQPRYGIRLTKCKDD